MCLHRIPCTDYVVVLRAFRTTWTEEHGVSVPYATTKKTTTKKKMRRRKRNCCLAMWISTLEAKVQEKTVSEEEESKVYSLASAVGHGTAAPVVAIVVVAAAVAADEPLFECAHCDLTRLSFRE
eukprot:ANDGO_00242.mRNA.1 hypothetical protein